MAQEGVRIGSGRSVAIGLGLGALTYSIADRRIARSATGTGKGEQSRGENHGIDLTLGSFLDGVPEQFVLGVGFVNGHGVSAALFVAIFVSNLPEGVGAATDLSNAGIPQKTILSLFVAVSLACALATVLGYAVADSISGGFQGAANGFAAGALLVMLIDSMIPDASGKAGRSAGLAAVVGFAVATALSSP